MITQSELMELLSYDPATGQFTWLKVHPNATKTRKDRSAGSVNPSGYRIIGIRRRHYYAHRLAWLYVYGEWPRAKHLDHINGIQTDNRIANLREASPSQNAANGRRRSNNTSGFRGVAYHKGANKWIASIRHGGRSHYLGLFDAPQAAHEAYVREAIIHHGEFARDDAIIPLDLAVDVLDAAEKVRTE